MSSFVINKEDYMKVAGLVAGLNDNSGAKTGIWLYNMEKYHLYTDDEIKEVFTNIYKGNIESVVKQYHMDSWEYTDSNDYPELFEEYKKYGKSCLWDSRKLEKAAYGFRMFCNSVSYQIEDVEINNKVMDFLNLVCGKVFSQLMSAKGMNDIECWGSFNLM